MLKEVLYLMFQLFLITWLGSFLIVGVFFLIRAYQLKLKNLIFGGISLILGAISQIGRQLFNFNLVITRIILSLSFIVVVVFTNTTFHKDRKSNLSKLFLIIIVINFFVQSYLTFLVMTMNSPQVFYLNVAHDTVNRFIVFGWLAWSVFSAYKEIKFEDIEPWIKARYKILFWVTFIFSFHNLPFFFQPWNIQFGDAGDIRSFIVFGIISVFAIIFAIGWLITWFMPNWFKRYLNKEYQPIKDKEFTEEELMTIIRKQTSEVGPNRNN